MIRIQRLKQPKKISGKELGKNQVVVLDRVKIINLDKRPIFVDTYHRKPAKPKVAAKKKKVDL